jgi:hypothetical protein
MKKKPLEFRESGRFWALKCSGGSAHPSILFSDTLEGIAGITRALMTLDFANPRCGPHVIMELIEKP